MREKIKNFGFAELNLKHTGNGKVTIDLVNRAIRMGYDSVAINIDIGNPFEILKERLAYEPEKKKKRGDISRSEIGVIPNPFKVDVKNLNQNDLQFLKANGKVFRQFSRITMTLEDQTAVHTMMKHPKVKAFDLVAVRITTREILDTLSRKGDFVDIITFDPTVPWNQSWGYTSSVPLFQAVGAEGIAFELSYSGALANSSLRSNFIANGRSLLRATRNGRNMFVSSGTTNPIEIRGPYDAANISALLGFNSFHGIHFVGSTPMNILLRSQARKLTIKGAIHVGDLKNIPHPTKTSKEALNSLLTVEEFKKQIKIDNSELMEIDC